MRMGSRRCLTIGENWKLSGSRRQDATNAFTCVYLRNCVYTQQHEHALAVAFSQKCIFINTRTDSRRTIAGIRLLIIVYCGRETLNIVRNVRGLERCGQNNRIRPNLIASAI